MLTPAQGACLGWSRSALAWGSNCAQHTASNSCKHCRRSLRSGSKTCEHDAFDLQVNTPPLWPLRSLLWVPFGPVPEGIRRIQQARVVSQCKLFSEAFGGDWIYLESRPKRISDGQHDRIGTPLREIEIVLRRVLRRRKTTNSHARFSSTSESFTRRSRCQQSRANAAGIVFQSYSF